MKALSWPAMHRHLIAFFALFTGIAALHAPANASVLESFVYDARALSKSGDSSAQQECVCTADQKAGKDRCTGKQRPTRRIVIPAILRGPVLMGVERSLE